MSDAPAPESRDGWVSVDAIAQLCSIDQRRIQQLAKDGVMIKGDRGRYHLARSVHGYIKFLQSRLREGETGGLGEHRKRLTSARADLAEMERQRVAGLLLPSDQVDEMWSRIVAVVKTRILAIPAKMAPRLLVLKRATEIEDALEKEVRDALEEIASTEV